MSTRVFDYESIKEKYETLKKIIGSGKEADTIAGVLYESDELYHNMVNVPNEGESAIYGDLGSHLLKVWESVSAGSFDAFVENFQNWANVVAQAAGNYAEFEDRVKNAQANNALGYGYHGAQTNDIQNSYYNEFYTTTVGDYAIDLQALQPIYALTGAAYIDTKSKENMWKKILWHTAEEALAVFSMYSGIKAAAGGIQALNAATSAKAAAGTAVSETTAETLTTGQQTTRSVADIQDDIDLVHQELQELGNAGNEGAEITAEYDAAIKKLTDLEAELNAAKGITTPAAQQAGQTLVTNLDDLVAQTTNMNSSQKAQFVKGLVDNGTIKSEEELLKFFGGNESVAKSTFGALNNGHGGSGVYREIVSGFDTTPVVVPSETPVAPVTVNAGETITAVGQAEVATSTAQSFRALFTQNPTAALQQAGTTLVNGTKELYNATGLYPWLQIVPSYVVNEMENE